MFDLDKAIANWRRQMHDAGIETPKILDELESHLRDDVEEQLRRGISEQEACEGAVQRMGQASPLAGEFAKGQGRNLELQRILKGFLCIARAGLIMAVTSIVFLGAGVNLQGVNRKWRKMLG